MAKGQGDRSGSAVTDFIRDVRAVPVRLVSGRGHYTAVIERVLAARQSVWIATANLKELMVEDHRARPGRSRSAGSTTGKGPHSYRSVLAAFDELVGAGVEIRLLHAAEGSGPFRRTLAEFPRLAAPTAGPSGLHMRLCPRVHLKLVIIDGAEMYLGSANWTGAGLGAKGAGRRNFELGLCSRDDLLLDEAQALFNHIWEGAPCAGCKLRPQCPAPLDAAVRGPPARRAPRRRAL